MDSLRSILLLALLALGHATSLTTVTQIPRTEDDVILEAVTDGFIVDRELLPSLTTPAPQNQTQRGITNEEEEGSAMGESPGEDTTIAPVESILTLPSPSPTLLGSAESNVLLNEYESSGTEEPTEDKEEERTTPAVTMTMLSDLGSGEGDTTFTPLIKEQVMKEGRKLGLGLEVPQQLPEEGPGEKKPQQQFPEPEMHAGHVTPDWIIILGFLVGLAALVLLCVAIATRERFRWNRYKTSDVAVTVSDQQKEVEMENFLHKKPPIENGQSEEYTVIPLDELQDNDSS